MNNEKTYTLDELKQKLIDLTIDYIYMPYHDNKDASDLLCLINTTQKTLSLLMHDELLEKYILHVTNISGKNYIDDYNKYDVKFDQVELQYLISKA